MEKPVFLAGTKGIHLAIQLESSRLILLDIESACFEGKYNKIYLNIDNFGAIHFLAVYKENIFIGYNKPHKE